MDKLKEYVELIMSKFDGNKKVVIVGLVVIGIILIASLAQAEQDHTCQGGHNCNDGGSGEQTQAQTQSQSSTATVTNEVVSTSDARANSISGSSSYSGGNSLAAVGGESRSSSDATGGSSESTIGISYDNTNTAHSAAVTFAGHCQSGASGQISGGGFSVINSEQFCDYIRLAAVMREAYEYEMRDCKCEGVCTNELATVEMNCQMTPEADKYLAAYHDNLWEAQELLQATETTGMIDRMTGQLLKVVGLIAILAL